jgi:hypothetical protein
MSTESTYFIGDEADYKQYREECNNGKADVSNLPVRNLPMSYFPFFYTNAESSIDKMQRLVPLFENYTKSISKITGDQATAAAYNINTDELFSLLAQLEEEYQPFNRNNAVHLSIVIFVIWSIIGILILKIINTFFKNYYVKIIIGCIFVLLLLGVIWALFVTNTVL